MTLAMAAPLTTVFAAHCRCGFDKTNRQIRADCRYSVFGYLALAIAGVNARPNEVIFRCQDCGTVLESNRDPEVLEKHRTPS